MATKTMRPEQTVAYRVYFNGTDLIGVASIDLPQFQFVTDTISGSGVAGEVENPTIGMTQSMPATLNFTSVEDEVWGTLDFTQSMNFECYSAQQLTDDATGARTSKQYRINLIGRPKNFQLGTMEQGKKHSNSLELECTRVQILFDEEEKVLYDKYNFIYKINGTDLFSGVRSQMGLAY